jgi:hypothetical protein
MLSRAERMLTASVGEDAAQTVAARTHLACALLKIGRHAQALPLFLRVIKVFETHPPDDGTYVLALTGASQIFAGQGQGALASEYLGRAQRLFGRMKQEAP